MIFIYYLLISKEKKAQKKCHELLFLTIRDTLFKLFQFKS